MSLSEFPLRKRGDAKSEIQYFHDQKGEFHDPRQITINPFQKKTFYAMQREEYMNESPSAKMELDRIKLLMNILRNDKKGLRLLGQVLKSCQDYGESINRLANVKRLSSDSGTEIYKMEVGAADSLRKQKHNTLIGEFAKLRRYMMTHYGPDGDIEAYDEKELPATVLFTGTASEVPSLPDKEKEHSLLRKALGRNACRYNEAIQLLTDAEIEILKEALA